jgi:glycosyltransferase involved in cell wall biosynthesis
MDLYVPGRIIIQHVHELSYASEVLQVKEALKESVSKTYRFIAASEAVAKFLTDEIYVPADKIIIIHEFPVSTSGIVSPSNSLRIREKYGISMDDSVIGMCGTPEWRKGVDLFVQLARTLREKQGGRKYHFLWIGGNKGQLLESLHDIRLARIESCIHFIGDVEFPFDYYGVMDLFALTSREDPFPVAMLEAASCGLPIICFDHAGGAPEFVGQDAGKIVPYLDIPGMANACEELLANDSLLAIIGAAAKNKVINLYSPERQLSMQLKVIQMALSDV